MVGLGGRSALALGPRVYSVYSGAAGQARLQQVNLAPGNILQQVEGQDRAEGTGLAGF